MLYYIYEVPGVKNGATIEWDKRSQKNFETYGIWPILIETMEGPNEPEFWQMVGDREWELANLNGYPKGVHYKFAREGWGANASTHESCVKGGKITGKWAVESGHLVVARAASVASPRHTSKQKHKCLYCDKVTNPGSLVTHMKACKHKKGNLLLDSL